MSKILDPKRLTLTLDAGTYTLLRAAAYAAEEQPAAFARDVLTDHLEAMLEKGVKGKGGKLIQRFMAAAAPGSFRPGMASAEELMAGVREQYRQRKAEDDAIRGMEYGEG